MYIDETNYGDSIRCSSDGSAAGTQFFHIESGERCIPSGVSVQQETISLVRVRFPAAYGIPTFVMHSGDSLILKRTLHE